MMHREPSDLKGGFAISVANVVQDAQATVFSPSREWCHQKEHLSNQILRGAGELSLEDALIPFFPGEKYCQMDSF